MKWKTAIFRFNFFIQLNSWTNKNFPDLNSERFQVKLFPISHKSESFPKSFQILVFSNFLFFPTTQIWGGKKYIWNRSEYDYGLSLIFSNFIYLAK